MGKSGIFSNKPKELSSFLRKHAINVDESHLDMIMKKHRFSFLRRRRNMGLHKLLQEAGCPVDSKLAESLELSFERR